MLAEAEAQALNDIKSAVSRFDIRGVRWCGVLQRRRRSTLAAVYVGVGVGGVLVPLAASAGV